MSSNITSTITWRVRGESPVPTDSTYQFNDIRTFRTKAIKPGTFWYSPYIPPTVVVGPYTRNLFHSPSCPRITECSPSSLANFPLPTTGKLNRKGDWFSGPKPAKDLPYGRSCMVGRFGADVIFLNNTLSLINVPNHGRNYILQSSDKVEPWTDGWGVVMRVFLNLNKTKLFVEAECQSHTTDVQQT